MQIWTIQEMNEPTAPCTNGNATYTNRVLSVGTSDVLSVVCWGSCEWLFCKWQAPICNMYNLIHFRHYQLQPTTSWMDRRCWWSGNGTWRIDPNGTISSGTGPSGAIVEMI